MAIIIQSGASSDQDFLGLTGSVVESLDIVSPRLEFMDFVVNHKRFDRKLLLEYEFSVLQHVPIQIAAFLWCKIQRPRSFPYCLGPPINTIFLAKSSLTGSSRYLRIALYYE